MILVNVHKSLAEASARHGAALGYAVQDNLFASIEWFQCLAEHGFVEPVEPRIYVATDAAAPAETAFLFCAAGASGELVSLTNFYTMEFSVVFAPDARRQAELIEALISYIAAERPRWRYVNLRLLRDENPVTALIETSLGKNGFATHRYFQLPNIYDVVEDLDFAHYYERRPSRMKNTIRRREKKLRSEHEVSIAQFDRMPDHFIRDYDAVYANSWQRVEAAPHLIEELCRVADRLDLLRCGLLYVDSVPAAAQIWLKSGSRAIIYKLAYDEKFADFSVGTILTRSLAEFVLARDRVTEIDFGVGGDAYKKDWMERERRLVGIEAFNLRTMAGKALAMRQWARSRVRKYMPADASS